MDLCSRFDAYNHPGDSQLLSCPIAFRSADRFSTGFVQIGVPLSMTEHAPRGSQDQNTFFPNSQFAMSQYSNGNGINYFYNNGQIPYSTVNSSYPTYSTNYLPPHNGPSSSMYLPHTSPMAMPYQLVPPARPPMPQSRPQSYPYHRGTLATQRLPPQRSRMSLASELNLNPMADIEEQTSYNSETMLSEPMMPPLEGYPDVKEFDELMRR